MGWALCCCSQECLQQVYHLPGLLCLLAGVTVVLLHHFNLDLLKTFFDLREDLAEECQEMTQVYINPHFASKGLGPLPPSKPSPSSI